MSGGSLNGSRVSPEVAKLVLVNPHVVSVAHVPKQHRDPKGKKVAERK